SPMRLAKRLALVVLLLAAWKVAMVTVQADTECTQGCGDTYSSCLAENADTRQMCYVEAQWAYNNCIMTSWDSAVQCIQNFYAYCQEIGGCNSSEVQQYQSECANSYQYDTWACASESSSATASCNVAEQHDN